MARAYPEIAPLWELRVSLSQMRLSDLAIGNDGRNRCLLSAFQARTGRNAPSNTKFIFGPSVWVRGLIKPKPAMGLAVVDWSQQEFGIAAALSEDDLMMKAYRSADPYLEFGKQAEAIPMSATKKTHIVERQQLKACVLGVNYGMGEQGLALRIGQPVNVARELIRLHKETYRDFWRWSDGAIDYAMFHGKLWTTFGWTIHVANERPNPRMLRNFPLQANAAEMLRLACCLILDRGINICAPIHDAVLIEAPLNEIDEKIKITQDTMAEASRIVLDGFELNSDAKVIRYPDRYMDDRGKKMWKVIAGILQNLSRK
jgi:DNA polymerase I-like protein with 3'-5' exonuclease and polymerase domains